MGSVVIEALNGLTSQMSRRSGSKLHSTHHISNFTHSKHFYISIYFLNSVLPSSKFFQKKFLNIITDLPWLETNGLETIGLTNGGICELATHKTHDS